MFARVCVGLHCTQRVCRRSSHLYVYTMPAPGRLSENTCLSTCCISMYHVYGHVISCVFMSDSPLACCCWSSLCLNRARGCQCLRTICDWARILVDKHLTTCARTIVVRACTRTYAQCRLSNQSSTWMRMLSGRQAVLFLRTDAAPGLSASRFSRGADFGPSSPLEPLLTPVIPGNKWLALHKPTRSSISPMSENP